MSTRHQKPLWFATPLVVAGLAGTNRRGGPPNVVFIFSNDWGVRFLKGAGYFIS